MPGKALALPAHKPFIASLNEMAPTFAVCAKNWKAGKVPPGVLGTLNALPKLIQWFAQNPVAYTSMIASAPAGKSKTARAGA